MWPPTMIDDNVLFSFASNQDYRDATQVIAEADQGGLGLPDRDYYTKDDANRSSCAKQYLAHVQKMFELLGDKPEPPLPRRRRSCASKPRWPRVR